MLPAPRLTHPAPRLSPYLRAHRRRSSSRSPSSHLCPTLTGQQSLLLDHRLLLTSLQRLPHTISPTLSCLPPAHRPIAPSFDSPPASQTQPSLGSRLRPSRLSIPTFSASYNTSLSTLSAAVRRKTRGNGTVDTSAHEEPSTNRDATTRIKFW